jgi:chorismate mutase / prephenate dehydrogenase
MCGYGSGSEPDDDAEVDQLKEYRSDIDLIDGQIIDLLAERMATVRKIGEIKQDEGLPVCVESRERLVLDRIAELAKEKDLPADEVRELFKLIIKTSRKEQEKIVKKNSKN